MSQPIKVAIAGGGWPGQAHARGLSSAGGFKVVAIADLIPERRKKLLELCPGARETADVSELIADKQIDALALCLPNHLHAPTALAALRGGKHVLCEQPPALSRSEAQRMESAAAKAAKVLLYASQRRFGAHEQAARQAVTKGYIGQPFHVRATWMRSRGVPVGTGWFADKSRSGGGALADLGVQMLDLGWTLLGEPRPTSVFGVTYRKFPDLAPADVPFDVEDIALAMLRFEDGSSLELAAAWAINQPPGQNGAVCRVYGQSGAVEVYTPQGATLYRNFDAAGAAKSTVLKPPATVHHVALARHFRECIAGRATPQIGGGQGTLLMAMLEAIYASAESGKSVNVK